MKYFLGIYHGHNATVAVLNLDGQVIDCVSEERFVNVKNKSGFPVHSLKYIKDKYKNDEILGIGLPFEFMNAVFLTESDGSYKKDNILNIFLRLMWRILLNTDREIYSFVYDKYKNILGTYMAKKQIAFTADYFKLDPKIVKGYNHHLCHAFPAYYLSPYNKEDALVLTLDGEGDGLSATVSKVVNGKFEMISTTGLGDSLGNIYLELTRYLGMKPNEHEYKVMGLAPYARAEQVEKVYKKIKDWVVVDGLEFRAKFDTHLAYKYIKKEMEGFRFDNIAGAFQKLVEEKMVEWVSNAIKETNLSTVCCSGGVFMNVKANMKVSQIPDLKKIWILPSCGDESTPLGAAISSYLDYCKENSLNIDIKPLKDLYLGPSFTNSEIEKFIQEKNIKSKYKVEYHTHIEKVIAQLIANGNVVANLSGRMEFGARALGNRSILANPTKPDVIKEINEYIKNRDFWMPFAASLLEERADDYVVNPKHLAADYMIMSFESTMLGKKELRTAMHQYDFTIRPQIVRRDWNSRYYRILKEFEALTGIGGILNTSFNLHGSPIVLGPKEAYYVFENSGIKYLSLENYLISKDV
ncbi:MAG TPA: carbamoyltransferase C-terminal domain-containing protein [Candidatus Saccharimonadales bacterium]|nr:carbamoyltransferase C-terminal domain-containing protein [Candidatus Saccharimonadales bacterium]